MLADVAAGLIWRFVYDGDYGLFAAISNFFGFANPYVLADKDVAIYAVLGVIVWKYFGFHMMLFIAGLLLLLFPTRAEVAERIRARADDDDE